MVLWAFLSLALAAVGILIALRYWEAHRRLLAQIAGAERDLTELSRTLDPGLFDQKQQSMLRSVAGVDHPKAVRAWMRYLCWGSLMRGKPQRELRAALARYSDSDIDPATLGLANVVEQLTGQQKEPLSNIVARFDAAAKQDALYQTVAGLALEQEGKVAAALDRYRRALELAPELAVAGLVNARLLLLKGDLGAARAAVALLGRSASSEAAVRVLDAMLWLSDPGNTGPLPSTYVLTELQASALPAPLAVYPHWLELRASPGAAAQEAACASATASVEQKLPGTTLLWSAVQALRARCISAAQTAAERALSLVPSDPRVVETVMLARLAEGRLERVQALLDSTPQTASWKDVLSAVRAYEEGNVIASIKAGLTARDIPPFAGIRTFPSVLEEGGPNSEEEITRLSHPSVAWGELVAVDSALNHGKLALADRLVAQWPSSYQSPAHLLRLARLARYQKKPDVAVNFAEAAAYGNTTRQCVAERVLSLFANKDIDGGVTVIMRFGEQLGSLKPWLEALLTARASPRAAQRLIDEAEPLGEAYPLIERVIAARALAASGDKRAKSYVQKLAEKNRDQPDLLATRLVK